MSIHKKLNRVMREVRTVLKGGKFNAGGANFQYHEHDTVTASLRASMVEHGITVSPRMVNFRRTERLVQFDVHLKLTDCDSPVDSPGAFVIWECPAECAAKGKTQPSDDKQIGVAASYAIKLLMLKGFMLTDFSYPDTEARDEERINEDTRDAAPANRPSAGGNPFVPEPDGDYLTPPDQKGGDWLGIIKSLLADVKAKADEISAGSQTHTIGMLEQGMAEAKDVFSRLTPAEGSEADEIADRVVEAIQRAKDTRWGGR